MTAMLRSATTVRRSALVVARVVDAASGRPRPVTAVTTPSPHVMAHVADGGYLVLTGRPELAVPDLAASAYELRARLVLPDAAAVEVTFALPAGTALPLRAPDVAVELPPTALAGTVRRAAFPNAPVAGATVTAQHAAPGRALLALRTPLAVEHPDGATVRPRSIGPSGPPAQLTEDAPSGTRTVALDDVTGCAPPNSLLVLGDPTTVEHVRIAAVDAPALRVELVAPLRRSRRAGDAVRAHTFTGQGATTSLARPAVPGDGVLVLAGATAPPLVQVGGPVPELRATGALADAGGRWRIDGFRAVGRIDVTADGPGLAAATVAYDVDYRRPNVLDLELTT